MRIMKKFVSWNVNGLRAVMNKGFEDFFREADADAFCLSFEHRNAGKPLGEAARTSIERTVAFIDGAERTR